MKITQTRKEFLSNTRTQILQGALNITEKKMKLKDLYKSLRIASADEKPPIQSKCSALQSELSILRFQISSINVSYSLIKNWKNETLREELLKKFKWKIYYHFKASNYLIDENTLSLMLEDGQYSLISKSERIDKRFIKELESRDALIMKIQKYGKEYAETLNLKHPFTSESYAGSTDCFYDRQDAWSFNYTETDIVILWTESSTRYGSTDLEERMLKIPLEYFSECAQPLKKAEMDHKIGIKALIEDTQKKISATSRNIANLKGNIYTYTKEFNTMIANYKKFCDLELEESAKSPFRLKIQAKNELIRLDELKLKELQDQLKKYKLELEG